MNSFVLISLGLSPPTRGSLAPSPHTCMLNGSIPAHAGEPSLDVILRAFDKVYPRPRGGALLSKTLVSPSTGLSPPTRGSPLVRVGVSLSSGSIPAHAGEPAGGCPVCSRTRVYPRPRGGARWRLSRVLQNPGLSPPTRGSPFGLWKCRLLPRSIPAHAGEPCWPRATPRSRTVYPRPRGGAHDKEWNEPPEQGLSPPTRGSRGDSPGREPGDSPGHGSIPAHAGEPRGVEHACPGAGSIPAHAGEPN